MTEGTTPETEKERLSRECRELYDDLHSKGLIEGHYSEWLEAAAKEAAKKLDPPTVLTASTIAIRSDMRSEK